MYTHVCAYLCVHICIYVHTYIYICICTCVYTYTYINLIYLYIQFPEKGSLFNLRKSNLSKISKEYFK